jgi:hypothetical protein
MTLHLLRRLHSVDFSDEYGLTGKEVEKNDRGQFKALSWAALKNKAEE